MAASLPRPGVEVIQEFRSVSPTVVTPTLVPCVVGVAKQLVELLVPDGAGGNSLNTDALIQLPGFFIAKAASGSPAVHTGLDGLGLVFSVNNGVAITVIFSDPTAGGLTPATVVSQVNAALSTLGVSSVVAETVGDDQWRLRTVGLGSFQSIYIDPTTAGAVGTAFGIGLGQTYTGLELYNQLEFDVPPTNFPDPRGNLEELDIEYSTVRAFVATEGAGSGVLEFKRTESFLRNGVVDDAAVVLGDVDLTTLTYPVNVQGDDLSLSVDGGATQTWTIAGSPANAAALIAELQANFTGVTIDLGPGSVLRVTSNTTGADSSVSLTGGALLTDLFTTGVGGAPYSDVGESIAVIDDGNGDVVSPILEFAGEDFTATQTQATLLGSAAFVGPMGAGDTLIISDGQQAQTVVFDGTETTIALVVAAIQAVMGTTVGGRITASDSGGALLLTHAHYGDQSVIKILGGTGLALIDPGGTPTIVAGAEARGTPHPPLAGDELYIDGLFYAIITQVAPGGAVDRLKIDRQKAITTDAGARFYIQAKNLVTPAPVNRPYPDLTIDLNGNVTLKHSFIRDPFGNPSAVLAPVYISYTSVRQDVTALAANPGLLRFDDTATLGSSLDPLSTDNPLGLGLFFALINATGAQVTGLGVDEISADAPYGTLDGFTRAAEFLEGFEVYALAPLTHDQTVAQVFNTHVNFMSQPENKGERIVLWNPSVPTHALDTLVASGTDGDGLTTATFDTKVATLSALVNNAGVSPVGTIPVSEGLYLDIGSDALRYSIKSISGSVVTVRTTAGEFAAGENDDGYFAEGTLPLPIISDSFAIRVRGAALLTPTGQQDKTLVAETMQQLGQSFLNRRFWMTFPDRAAATLDGLEQIVEGFYMNAAIVGMIAQQPPQQSFTNFPMTGFTRVLGSNDTFSERHLNVMAAGGTYIIIQDGQGAPLTARMALTTDLTSIETRTDSITKVVDFAAKFMRKGLRNFIGRFNITQSFLDSLGNVIQGLLGFLTESGILIGGNLNNIIQDEDAPDTVLIDVTLDVPYPANYIRLTLVV